ncbi:hypothetical protein SAMD00019534_097460 [Acytostelium subglobosum LB1]|uniref:hypothetical protein n=1 Tax=Acytostelium subglobosum LB1 TaxID=1410327 RepID=UPI00064508CC|nr:hypothetical protein SAMD00019534_097460 [Acytostelium subglobosum LB1]GAM26571.1 hypothetical protein SAMD00019534_097460 [Acytostelium subglobosum LB1]|eukprot:XP_012750667.1 hypothetical protein SAMD00019534_097460 [Acytostelium subglobosum LB1]
MVLSALSRHCYHLQTVTRLSWTRLPIHHHFANGIIRHASTSAAATATGAATVLSASRNRIKVNKTTTTSSTTVAATAKTTVVNVKTEPDVLETDSEESIARRKRLKMKMTEELDGEKDVPPTLDYGHPGSAALTPAMMQYHHFKKKYPNHILLFRIGDFYEMFFDDAVTVSSLLHITLTTRGVKSAKTDTPMCGFPQHAADTYIEKLIRHGKTVAVCDQVEEIKHGKAVSGNKVVKRDVVRVVTPGTVFEDRFLQPFNNNFLMSIAPAGIKPAALSVMTPTQSLSPTQLFSLAWLDLSTGHFFVSETTLDSLSGELYRVSPSELLLPQSLAANEQLSTLLKPYHVTVQDATSFSLDNNAKMFNEAYEIEPNDVVEEFPSITKHQLGVVGSVLNYVYNTQLGKIPHIDQPQLFSAQTSMFIDFSTRNSLEISKTFQGLRKGSLLDTIDRTLTSTGSRLLHSRIQSPCLSIKEIEHRLNAVEFFYHRPELVRDCRRLLSKCYDLERCLQRVFIGRAGPRDLASIGATLVAATMLKQRLIDALQTSTDAASAAAAQASTKTKASSKVKVSHDPILEVAQSLVDQISDFDGLLATLSEALVDNPPYLVSDGGFIQRGYSKELDDTMTLRDKSKDIIDSIQAKYRKQLGIPSLKIKHNQTIGYFVEIMSQNREKVPNTFIHVQTLINHMRFKSKEMIELEERINRASSEALEIEQTIFRQLCTVLSLDYGDMIKSTSKVLATIDISCSFGLIAKERGYNRPKLTEKPILNIEGGRHPTVEIAKMEKEGSIKSFITNDCHLDYNKDSLLWLITGPNMGGKSTFLRQNALISIMAQVGSFVPADKAEIGIIDSIFSRVGSSDDLANDKSTFMVEMIETASILKKATSKSFVIMDEVGRGTSTLDGLAIAQSVIEHLYHGIKCRTLFATHHHELTKLSHTMKKIKCHALAVKEDDGELLFTHKILPGISNKSYGIFCAKLAGIPDQVIKRSQEILATLESSSKE